MSVSSSCSFSFRADCAVLTSQDADAFRSGANVTSNSHSTACCLTRSATQRLHTSVMVLQDSEPPVGRSTSVVAQFQQRRLQIHSFVTPSPPQAISQSRDWHYSHSLCATATGHALRQCTVPVSISAACLCAGYRTFRNAMQGANCRCNKPLTVSLTALSQRPSPASCSGAAPAPSSLEALLCARRTTRHGQTRQCVVRKQLQ